MINKEKIFAGTWNSCLSIDETINYINTLSLTDEQFKKLEELFYNIIDSYSGMKERAFGDDV